MNPKISVVIPLYNKQEAIESTIHSVLSQTVEPFEIIVVDDGSTDESVSKVCAIKSQKIRLIRKENGGVSSARNVGMSSANGDWIHFLDADDTLESNIPRTMFLLVIIGEMNMLLIDARQLKVFVKYQIAHINHFTSIILPQKLEHLYSVS